MNKVLSRNGRLDLYKFIFAIVIMFLHYRFRPVLFSIGNHSITGFQTGHYAVIFFFIVSGALFSMSCFRKKDEWKSGIDNVALDTRIFIFSKFRQLVSWYLVALFIYAVNDIVFGIGIKKTIEKIFYTVPSMFLLGRTGFDNQEIYMGGYYVGASWYISALFILFLFFFPLIRLNYNFFTKVISPMIFVGSLYINITFLKDHILGGRFFAILPFVLGIIVGDAVSEMKEKEHEFINRNIWLLRILEVISYGATFLYICIDVTKMPFSDYPMLFITGCGVLMTLMNRSHGNIWDRKALFTLGDVSHVLYMIHIPVLLVLESILKRVGVNAGDSIKALMSACIAIICAFVLLKVENTLKNKNKSR